MRKPGTRLHVVGDHPAGSLAAAARYYQQQSVGSSNLDGVVAKLGDSIEQARVALEGCLQGHDAFDALAFHRMAAGPWDFRDVRESQSTIEWSQASQDVAALAFLGMGLPRQPLTGENSGQPDLGKVNAHAADIVRAAQARALMGGHLASQPLGTLAGQFLAYELSVRGRQYVSIATEMNDGLLADHAVADVTRDALGFTLTDIRAVRDAAIGLLNSRFFGARDRVGEAAETGLDLGPADPDAFRSDINLMLNECRLFGSVSAADVAARAGLDEAIVTAVLDFFSVRRPDDGEENPLILYAAGRPLGPWGCISDKGEYLLLNGFLAEDELRRDVERGLLRRVGDAAEGAAKDWSRYERRRAAFAEAMAVSTLARLLGGGRPCWTNQSYLGPTAPDDAPRLAQDSNQLGVDTKVFESDALFVIDGVAFCVEVKAGSVTAKARGGNAQRLSQDLEKTLKEANDQAARLARLIRTNRGVWGGNGKWTALPSVSEVHSVIVMLDDLGPLSLSMNELVAKGIIDSEEMPWVVSLHDLVVIGRTIDHAAQFLEFLRRRRGRRLATMVNGVDELDMFMWFMGGGMYFEPDPRDVAAQVPVEGVVTPSAQRRYDAQARVRLGTLTDPLDAWFYRREGLSSDSSAKKPVRLEQPWVEDYLAASASQKSPGWLRFGADLVGLSGKAQQQLGKNLLAQCKKTQREDIEHSLTTHGTTSEGSWLLAAVVVPEGADTDHLYAYVEAKQYQTKASRSMLLLYNADGSLRGSHYCGESRIRSAERDAAIEAAPLFSLASTFNPSPPSARRATHQLRGKRTKKGRKR